MILAGNVHRPGLPNHDDPDLPRVLQIALDPARDLGRDDDGKPLDPKTVDLQIELLRHGGRRDNIEFVPES